MRLRTRTATLASSYNVAATTLELLMTLSILILGAWLAMQGKGFTIGMLSAWHGQVTIQRRSDGLRCAPPILRKLEYLLSPVRKVFHEAGRERQQSALSGYGEQCAPFG